MKIEFRTDGAHISGYVNVTEKKSNPLYVPKYGTVIETIAPGAFQRAIDSAKDIFLSVDHGEEVFASISSGTLDLYEDRIGLHADAIITDESIISAAKNEKIVGWSFGFVAKDDFIRNDAGSIPLRVVRDLDLQHATLVINKKPSYDATSVEFFENCSARESEMMENKLAAHYAEYKARIDKIAKPS